MKVTILGANNVRSIDARKSDTGLWLEAEVFQEATGWVLKPEGFCKHDRCVPILYQDENVKGTECNALGIARLLNLPAIYDAQHHILSLGDSTEDFRGRVRTPEAPDFTLSDFHGQAHSLHEYRGKKVLLMSWASW
jgi:hypothetical protein